MKTKKIYILLLSILLTTQVYAERNTFKERADNWLQQSESAQGKPGIGGGTPTADDPEIFNGPVGSVPGILMVLVFAYGAGVWMRKKSLKEQA